MNNETRFNVNAKVRRAPFSQPVIYFPANTYPIFSRNSPDITFITQNSPNTIHITQDSKKQYCSYKKNTPSECYTKFICQLLKTPLYYSVIKAEQNDILIRTAFDIARCNKNN